jgi:hypothetical protein
LIKSILNFSQIQTPQFKYIAGEIKKASWTKKNNYYSEHIHVQVTKSVVLNQKVSVEIFSEFKKSKKKKTINEILLILKISLNICE